MFDPKTIAKDFLGVEAIMLVKTQYTTLQAYLPPDWNEKYFKELLVRSAVDMFMKSLIDIGEAPRAEKTAIIPIDKFLEMHPEKEPLIKKFREGWIKGYLNSDIQL